MIGFLKMAVVANMLELLTAVPTTAQDRCYADWSIAAIVVLKESLKTVEELTDLARSKVSGTILKTTLCQQKGVFVYRLVVRDKHGKLRLMTVDARKPFDR